MAAEKRGEEEGVRILHFEMFGAESMQVLKGAIMRGRMNIVNILVGSWSRLVRSQDVEDHDG